MEQRRRVVILGAAGRDFHTFNMLYRDDPASEVVAFTMTQIPGVGDRLYPPDLAGQLYPEGIPIVSMDRLDELLQTQRVDDVVFAYSDVTHADVMHLASQAMAGGADFRLYGPESTYLRSAKPVVAVAGVRTGVGKSPIARWLSRFLRRQGRRVAVLRHPMPYGDLRLERIQRFAALSDLVEARCTAEEREEYEPHLEFGNVIFAGVDYGAILELAEAEADIMVWDGGNNDYPFVAPDLLIVVVDALRPDQLTTHHPGELVLRSADIVVINKVNAADAEVVARLADDIRRISPRAIQVLASSPVVLDAPDLVEHHRAIVVEDGPTTTHGGMSTGAGYSVTARIAAEIVDPRPGAHPLLAEIYDQYPHIGPVLPAIGYNDEQLAALESTISASDADVVVSGTPIDLAGLISVDRPIVRARYEFQEVSQPTLESLVTDWLVTSASADD